MENLLGKHMMSALMTFLVAGLVMGFVAYVVSTRWPNDWVRLFVSEVCAGIGIAVLLALLRQ